MRDDRDIKTARIELSGTVEIDLERIEQDPYWMIASREFNTEDPAQLKLALQQYICLYLGQQSVLGNAPFTNGPVAIFGTNAEVL